MLRAGCRRTQRFEAHIWEDRRQVYLGAYDAEEHAAKVGWRVMCDVCVISEGRGEWVDGAHSVGLVHLQFSMCLGHFYFICFTRVTFRLLFLLVGEA